MAEIVISEFMDPDAVGELASEFAVAYGPTAVTPHIAGVTAESNVRVSRLIAEKVGAHLRSHLA